MSLEEIRNGSLADPSVVNKNFEYLDDRITDTANKIYTNNASFDSKIATLSNNITNLDTKMKNDISEQSKRIDGMKTDVTKLQSNITSAIVPNYSKGVGAGNGYVAPSNGWLRCAAHIERYQSHVRINGVVVFAIEPMWLKDWSGWNVYGMVFIGKGQTVTLDGNATATFYPCVGL